MNRNRFAGAKLTIAATGLLFASQAALGCTLANWNPGAGGSTMPTAGSPAPENIARYSGACGMQAADGTVSYVQDDSPGGIDRIVARFYVLNNLDPAQDAVVYRGFSTQTGTGNLFTVRFTTDGNVRLIDNATGTSVSQAASNPWASVEIDWTQGSPGSISLSVDGQTAVTQSVSNAGAALQSVRLGNLTSANGSLTFDAYESRRSTPIGRLCVGDADSNGSIQFFDVTAIFDEVSSAGLNLATGQPDVDENGQVQFFDVSDAFELVSGAIDCP